MFSLRLLPAMIVLVFLSKGFSWTIASLPGLLIVWSFAGRLLAFFQIRAQNRKAQRRIMVADIQFLRFLHKWGWIPVILIFITPAIASLIFHATPPDINGDQTYANAIIGTLPWNDSHAYYSGASFRKIWAEAD